MQLIVRCTQFKRCLNVIKYVLESFVIQHHCDHTNRKICIGSNLLKFLERSISQLNCRDKMYHQEFFNFHWLSLALVLQDCLTTPATKVILVSCWTQIASLPVLHNTLLFTAVCIQLSPLKLSRALYSTLSSTAWRLTYIL